MNQDNIKQLFDSFEPALRPDSLFMERVENAMRTVEALKKENAALRARSRKAVAIGAIAGFIAGIVTMLLLPNLQHPLARLAEQLAAGGAPHVLTDNLQLVAWIISAFASVTIALNAYEASLRAMRSHSSAL